MKNCSHSGFVESIKTVLPDKTESFQLIPAKLATLKDEQRVLKTSSRPGYF